MTRVAVIGAGMGGLASAARLAALGHQVTVLEQADTYGGKLGSYERDGFVFDTGPSLLTIPAIYRDLFLKTGRGATAALEQQVDLVPLETAFNYRFADGSSVAMPGAGVGMAATALGDAFGAQAAADWKSLMAHAADTWAVTRGPFLQSPLDGAGTLIRLARRRADIRAVAPFTSLRGIGRRHLTDPRLRTLLDRYATYTGSDPRLAPAALVTIPYVEQTFGAWHIAGGIRRLADALATRCAELGVSLRYGADVAAVDLVDGRVGGVRLSDGERLDTEVVVSDADATHLYADLLPRSAGTAPMRRLRRATPSLAGFVMLLAVDGRTPGLQHHNVWFPDDYDAEFDGVFGGRPVDEPAIYACVPDDAAMRPDADTESWFVLVNAPRHDPDGGMDWTVPGLADAYADRMLALLAARGVDIRSRIRWRELRTPYDLQASSRAPGGSIYGTSSNGRSAAFLRPANRSPVPGLFLVGGSAHPGGGLPLVGMSAEIVASLLGPA